jgi:DNA polymerase I
MASQSSLSDTYATASCTPDQFSGIKIAINQVEYSNAPDGPIIHIFGRDVKRKAIRLDITGFRPYFYVPADQAESTVSPPQVTIEPGTTYRSIRGEPLRRLFTQRPTDVRDVRERYRHFEADIPFATRYMIDSGLTGGISAPENPVNYHDVAPAKVETPARICILDIECEDERGFPDPQRDAITCITCHDSFDNDYTTFLLPAELPLR